MKMKERKSVILDDYFVVPEIPEIVMPIDICLNTIVSTYCELAICVINYAKPMGLGIG